MRLFLALAPDEAARAALARTACMLRPLAPGRYVPPSLYHITLAFLGETDAARLPAVREAMEVAARRSRRFPLALGRLGAFGSVLWRGVEADGARPALALSLREELRARAVPFDPKPLRAHITLARDARLTEEARRLALPEAVWQARSLTLYQSVRREGALQYLPCAEAVLP